MPEACYGGGLHLVTLHLCVYIVVSARSWCEATPGCRRKGEGSDMVYPEVWCSSIEPAGRRYGSPTEEVGRRAIGSAARNLTRRASA